MSKFSEPSGGKAVFLREDRTRAQGFWAIPLPPIMAAMVIVLGLGQLFAPLRPPGHLVLLAVQTLGLLLFWRGHVVRRRLRLAVPSTLIKAMRQTEAAWKSLPPDLRTDTGPILDAAYRAVVLPDLTTATAELRKRRDLLEAFAAEAEQRKKDGAVEALGSADLDAGQHALEALRELRAVGEVT